MATKELEREKLLGSKMVRLSKFPLELEDDVVFSWKRYSELTFKLEFIITKTFRCNLSQIFVNIHVFSFWQNRKKTNKQKRKEKTKENNFLFFVKEKRTKDGRRSYEKC